MYLDFFKRYLDLILSIILLIILAPLMGVVCIVIKADSKGPVFFRQKRLGRMGETFEILKFRTMVVGAEKIGDGISVNSIRDNRITRIGRILRKTSIDEVPQLWNVIKGEMSLVGPRPPVVYHPYKGYEGYPEWAKKRFEVPPGITGLAQVAYRNRSTWDERMVLDVEYVKKLSLFMDIKLLIKTVFNVYEGET